MPKEKLKVASFSTSEFKHAVAPRGWEAPLGALSTCKETEAAKVLADGKKLESEYLKDRNDSPDAAKQDLIGAQRIYAGAIVGKKGSADIHFQLGLVTEELYHLTERESPAKGNIADASGNDEDDDDDFGLQDMGSDITKGEDIGAVCELHGVAKNAAATEILKVCIVRVNLFITSPPLRFCYDLRPTHTYCYSTLR